MRLPRPHHGNQIVGAREAADVRGEKAAVGRHRCPRVFEPWKNRVLFEARLLDRHVFVTTSIVGDASISLEVIQGLLAGPTGRRPGRALTTERAYVKPRIAPAIGCFI